MALPLYLAMTEAEINGNARLPERIAYMACHFSSYGSGLEGLPEALPAESMLILNDRVPVWAHDPVLVAGQLRDAVEETGASAVLLDFQRPGCEKTAAIVQKILQALACPVCVTEPYARELSCPVLIEAPPPNRRLKDRLAPWQGRELWLDAAPGGLEISVTKTGSHLAPVSRSIQGGEAFRDVGLHCSYQAQLGTDGIIFALWRDSWDLQQMLLEAETLGVTRAVGLYQELAVICQTKCNTF